MSDKTFLLSDVQIVCLHAALHIQHLHPRQPSIGPDGAPQTRLMERASARPQHRFYLFSLSCDCSSTA